jgi:hypothetical protein
MRATILFVNQLRSNPQAVGVKVDRLPAAIQYTFVVNERQRGIGGGW